MWLYQLKAFSRGYQKWQNGCLGKRKSKTSWTRQLKSTLRTKWQWLAARCVEYKWPDPISIREHFMKHSPTVANATEMLLTSKCTINTLCPQYNAQWVMLYEGLSQLINKVYLFSGNSPQDAWPSICCCASRTLQTEDFSSQQWRKKSASHHANFAGCPQNMNWRYI